MKTENISLQVLLPSERTHRFRGTPRIGLLPCCRGGPGVGWSQERSREAGVGRHFSAALSASGVKLVKLATKREAKRGSE